VLALAWGYVIQKTESLWGSVLFHAGADLLIILGIFETYGLR
jgi:membrane protease YdiL (CAAX protease family)